MKVGDKVRCPYSKEGVITGFISKETAMLNVDEVEQSIRGKKIITQTFTRIHVYDIDQLTKIEGDK